MCRGNKTRMATQFFFVRDGVDAVEHEADKTVALAAHLAITCLPSMRTGPGCTPKAGAAAAAWAASAAAIKSLLGMQPTLAQVVPYGPLSIISTRLPCMRAALCAVMPAVPLPITATSTRIVFMVLSIH